MQFLAAQIEFMDTKKLRQKILDLAIHGKLVPQDPNDEPASVLLERIKVEKERLIQEGKIKRSKKAKTSSDTPHYENVPFEVPESWVWATLGEISNYGDSNNVSVTDIADDEWILELEDLEKDTASIIQILSKKERSIKGVRHKFKKGDVLYSKLRTYLNKVLVAPQTGYCTTEIIPFNSYCDISTHYLCHVLRSAYFLDYTQQCGYGVKMPRLSTSDACKGMIPLPPLAEQQRIVAEIERWFSLIDIIEYSKQDLQTTIKQAKNKILDLAIHGKLVPQDPNDEPAIELLKRINPDFTPCDNGHYPFEIPNVWQWCTINDISQVITGSTPSKNNIEYYGGNFPFYKPTDLDTGRHVMKASEYLTEKGKSVSRIIPPKSIAICCIGSIGKTGYIEVEGTTNQQINTIVPKRNLLNSVYGYYTCISDYFVNKLINSSSAITISIINKSKLQSVMFPLPPLTEQQRIVQKIEELFSVLDNIQKALEV